MTTPDPQLAALALELAAAETSGDAAAVAELLDAYAARYAAIGRGGTTGNKLPYPNPTDPVAEGAAAIRALAEALDPFAGDTGWMTPALMSGFVATDTSTEVPQCRRRGGVVYWRGGIKAASGNLATGSTFNVMNVGAIPPECRPFVPVSSHFGGAQSPTTSGIIRVPNDGSMQFRTSTTAAAYQLLSSVIYPAASMG